jgi:hypothetical protein
MRPLLPLLTLLLSQAAHPQQLPPPSRTVYKCQSGDKTVYSDVPCLAAKKLDVEPTRGLTTTGKERPGVDVRHERDREQMVKAVRPLTGMDAKQSETFGRRLKLSQEGQRECRSLDSRIAGLEALEQQARGPELARTQSVLLAHRQRFRALRCNG